MSNKRFDIAGAFLSKQTALEATYSGIRAATAHPGTIGDEAEADWIGLCRNFLPARYEVGPIFAVDHTGASSDQIDVAVYDQHFSPQWFGTRAGVRFVPVESVYAVFEVKPALNKGHLEYAQNKVASVRNLARTSAPIIHAGGKYNAASPEGKPIIGGLLSTRCDWTADSVRDNLQANLPPHGDPGFLNLGIALDTIAFDYTPDLADADDQVVEHPSLTFSASGQQLIHFAIRLFRQLQSLGSAIALDMSAYERSLNAGPSTGGSTR